MTTCRFPSNDTRRAEECFDRQLGDLNRYTPGMMLLPIAIVVVGASRVKGKLGRQQETTTAMPVVVR